MADQVAELLTRLQDPRLVKKLREWWENTTGYAWSVYVSDLDVTRQYQGNWAESLGEAKCNYGECPGFEDIVRSLSSPRVVTSLEILRAFEVYIDKPSKACFSDFDEIYGHFLDHVEHHLLSQHSSPTFQICRLTELPATEEGFPDWFYFSMGKLAGEAELLGRSVDPVAIEGLAKQLEDAGTTGSDDHFGMGLMNGIQIEPSLEFDRQDARYGIRKSETKEAILHMRLSWVCSPVAMITVAEELLPILKSAVFSASLLSCNTKTYEFTETRLPHIPLFQLRDQLPFIRFCVASLWATSPKGDFLDKRLANAVRLLSESDKQTEDAIGLALSITALDALLGREEQGNSLSEILATNVATLAEPDLAVRNDAITFVKKLYNKRSKALHGVTLEGDAKARENARFVAAGVLKAVWEHRTSPTGAERDEAFFKMLRDRNRMEGLPDGVIETPIRRLWNKEPDTAS